jgi:hypothetical protein
MPTTVTGLVRIVGDDSWRWELCPECSQRLIGLGAWKEHRDHHGWGTDWFAARMRAAFPGEIVSIDPRLFDGHSEILEVQTVDGVTWKAGISP